MNQEWWALSGGRAWHGVIPGCEKVALPQEGKKSGVVLQRSEGARSSRSAKAEEERGDESTRFRPLSHDDLMQAKPLPELKEPVAEEKNNAEVEKSKQWGFLFPPQVERNRHGITVVHFPHDPDDLPSIPRPPKPNVPEVWIIFKIFNKPIHLF